MKATGQLPPDRPLADRRDRHLGSRLSHLNLSGLATITITDYGHGEIALGALQAGLDIEYSRSSIGFTWQGFDEMDEVSGDGSAELLHDSTIQIEFGLPHWPNA